ncbi:CMRF35-like molecule 1 isoform X9 [Sciurus carolinensis]|uniref:CMRF35-like molecule 1 isoform X9 n=1 Tax=Sciurus carolinensis TaxID=30640 RepID=UPI001FB44B5A|nr:CMRF35-like molecule 1 isoform X9 [Sciurus carolinensis]
MHLLWLFPLLLWPLGYSTAQNEVTGPKTESGPERGSLTVQCNYTSKWKTHRKYWCGGAQWSSCRVLVITTGSEQEVKKDRVSIRDDQEKLTFMVTMVDLRTEDTGFYWCAIERTGIDYRFQVNVNVDPAPTTVSTTVPTTSTYAAPDPTENTDSLPTLTSYYSNSRCGAVARAGAAAPGGGPLLCQPVPAAAQILPGLLPEKGLYQNLCPG